MIGIWRFAPNTDLSSLSSRHPRLSGITSCRTVFLWVGSSGAPEGSTAAPRGTAVWDDRAGSVGRAAQGGNPAPGGRTRSDCRRRLPPAAPPPTRRDSAGFPASPACTPAPASGADPNGIHRTAAPSRRRRPLAAFRDTAAYFRTSYFTRLSSSFDLPVCYHYDVLTGCVPIDLNSWMC